MSNKKSQKFQGKKRAKAKLNVAEDKIGPLQDEIKGLQVKVGDLDNKLKSALADYQNLKKDVAKQKEKMADIVRAEIFTGLIDMFTDLKISVDNLDKVDEDNPWLQGILNLLKQYKDLLKQHNIEEIVFKEGDRFDYNQAMVIGTIAGDKDNIVASNPEPGYRIGDRIIKPAKVIVYQSN